MHNARRKSDPNDKEERKCNLRKLSQKKWTQNKSTTKYTETSSSSSFSAQMENRCFFLLSLTVECLVVLDFRYLFYDQTNCVPSRMAKLKLLMPKIQRNQLFTTQMPLDHNCMSKHILSWPVVVCEIFQHLNRPRKSRHSKPHLLSQPRWIIMRVRNKSNTVERESSRNRYAN